MAVKELLQRANAGDVNAQFEFAKSLWEGRDGIKSNKNEALIWFKRAAQSGVPEYQMHLGCILCWEDQFLDFEKGIEWIKLAAEQGYTGAQYFLGTEFATGENLGLDLKKAKYWYEKAADAGHSEAQYNLGVMYLKGEGVRKNFTKGREWILKSAENGEVLAMDLLSKAFRDGLLGFRKDAKQALFWKQKYDEAQNLE